jgi:hypothetical protein
MRRTLIICAALVATAAASVSIARATSTSSPTAHPQLARSVHLVRSFGAGPTMSLGGGAASATAPDWVTFRLPTSASTYGATITISLGYRTTGSLTYAVSAELTRASGGDVSVLPARRSLAASNRTTSTTVVFRTALHSGVTYTLTPLASVYAPGLEAGSITTSHVLVDVEAWPTS